jgi:hypothetical protein
VLFKVTRAAFDSVSKMLHLQLRGEGDEGDDDTAVPVDDAPFFSQLGIAVRPTITSTLRAMVRAIGDEMAVVGLIDRPNMPTDVPEGATRVYAVGLKTNWFELRASGVIVAQNGNKPVAHEGSSTAGHTHNAGTMTAGPYPVTGVTASATDAIATGQGSANFLVPDT